MVAVGIFLELNRYVVAGGWIYRFLCLFCLLCEAVKMYVVIVLYTRGMSAEPPVHIQGPDFYVYIAKVSMIALMTVVPIFCPIGREDIELAKGAQTPNLEKNLGTESQEEPLLPVIDSDAELESEEKPKGEFPDRSANIVSRMFFCWMCPLLCRGYKRPLQYTDIWDLRSVCYRLVASRYKHSQNKFSTQYVDT